MQINTIRKNDYWYIERPYEKNSDEQGKKKFKEYISENNEVTNHNIQENKKENIDTNFSQITSNSAHNVLYFVQNKGIKVQEVGNNSGKIINRQA